MTKEEIDRMNDLLKQIDEMKTEEVEMLEESYRDYEENRANTIGIL